jgi:hypothetical protein
MGPEQPAPLGPRYLNELNPAQLTRAITALVQAFEELDLANLSWAYWHACAATPHIAPAHFGAAIEALQNAYIKCHPGVVAETWAPRTTWKRLRTNMAAAIDDAEISDQAKAALKVKLATFNTVDQRPRLKAVMAAIGLQLGGDEDAAWRRRNKAAHGTPVPEGEELAACSVGSCCGSPTPRTSISTTRRPISSTAACPAPRRTYRQRDRSRVETFVVVTIAPRGQPLDLNRQIAVQDRRVARRPDQEL